MRDVIIGAGAAGISAAEAIRSIDQEVQITMISSEEKPLYSRPLISYYLAGKLKEEEIFYRSDDFFEKNNIDPILKKKAVKVNTQNNTVKLQTGEEIEYDNLLLATGSSPKIPSIEGLEMEMEMEMEGVIALRTLEDVKEILSLLPKVRKAVVLGGGLVGLKAAEGLHLRGVEVTVSVSSAHVLSQMIDAGAAQIYEKLLKEKGIRIATGTRPSQVMGDGSVRGIKMESGEELECQLVVIGKGVSANMDLIENTKIEREYGVIIDDHCQTNVKNVWAAGDVAQSLDVVRGEKWTNALWPSATEQGKVAGLNMASKEAIYKGSMGMNSIQFFGLPVISAGLAGLREKGWDEEIIKKDERRRIYKRLLLKENKVVGFVLVGDVKNAGIIRSLIAKGVDIREIKGDILKDTFNFSSIAPLVKENEEKFPEGEYQRIRRVI
jgi:NAD(P)H-nitrite reductase large subunit